jgi:hypothetical protein
VSRRQLRSRKLADAKVCITRILSLPSIGWTRTQRRKKMLLEDKNAVIYAKCNQSA